MDCALRIGCAALAFVASASTARAQGIALFGDARVGLGYNIDNDGEATGADKLRGVSRIRFGVNMPGESDSGIVFGGEIRADNAQGGEGGTVGQFEGSVFVSGAFGTLSFGDTDGADAEHVGDLPEVGLTELGSQGETPFISNGGDFGEDGSDFAENPEARPTVRYDYDIAGFGVSLSSNRDLDDVGVGGSWTGDVGEASVFVGLGYYKYSEFIAIDADEDEAPAAARLVPPGEQWSATVGGEFGAMEGTVIYSTADSDGDAGFTTLGAGLSADLDAWAIDLYYIRVLDAFGSVGDFDRDDSLGLGAAYELGGGALVQGGIARTYARQTVADFGIAMAF